MLPGWKSYGNKVSEGDTPAPGPASSNQPTKRKIDIVDSMTQATLAKAPGTKSKAKASMPAASTMLYKAPPAQMSPSSSNVIEVVDIDSPALSAPAPLRREREQIAAAKEEEEATSSPEQIPGSPETTISAEMSATEDASTVRCEKNAAHDEEQSPGELDSLVPTQPAEGPSYNGILPSRLTPQRMSHLDR